MRMYVIESQAERAIDNILNSIRGIGENTEWVWYRSKHVILRLFTDIKEEL
jgi:hypothetical protein